MHRVYLDEQQENADWIKTMSWDLPTDKDHFLASIGGPDRLAHFMTLPAAEAMPPSLRSELAVDAGSHHAHPKGIRLVRIKYSDDEPRDDHGRWTDGGESDTAVGLVEHPYEIASREAFASLNATGGATVSAQTGLMPSSGIAVATSGNEQVVHASDVTQETIKQYISDHADALAAPGAHLGLWEENGLVHMDVSEVHDDPAHAAELGLARGEMAGYNLATGDTIQFESGKDAEHPIQTSSVDVAAHAIADGKYVNLDQPVGPSTLLDKLADQAQEAKASGKVLDLEKVTIQGTNLFLNGNLGVPRSEMPQFITDASKITEGSPLDQMIKDGTLVPDSRGEVNISGMFFDHLQNDMGISTTHNVEENAGYLRATQSQLDGGKVGGMVRSIEGTDPGGRHMDPTSIQSVITTKDDYVLDGHHQWAATVGAQYVEGHDMFVNTQRIEASITDVLREAQTWTEQMGIAPRGVGKSRAFYNARVKYSPDEERDDHGRFSGGGSSEDGAGDRYEVRQITEDSRGKPVTGRPTYALWDNDRQAFRPGTATYTRETADQQAHNLNHPAPGTVSGKSVASPQKRHATVRVKYSDDQERDDHGRFAGGGGSDAAKPEREFGAHRTDKWQYDPRDTDQQRSALRRNSAAQRNRAEFPAGTRVVSVGARPDAQIPGGTGNVEPKEAARGTVDRTIPSIDAQGGTVRVNWDNGASGSIGPIGLVREDEWEAYTQSKSFAVVRVKYSDDEERDYHGRWTDGGESESDSGGGGSTRETDSGSRDSRTFAVMMNSLGSLSSKDVGKLIAHASDPNYKPSNAGLSAFAGASPKEVREVAKMFAGAFGGKAAPTLAEVEDALGKLSDEQVKAIKDALEKLRA